jgi:hypothetical protein
LLLIINQERSGHHDEDATTEAGLDIGCGDLMLNLLEW